MDNDSTTIARARASIDPDLKKKSDRNHTIKSLVNMLIDLSTTHKKLKNPKLRNYLVRCIMYAIHQNQGNPTDLCSNLQQIVPHSYGKNYDKILNYLLVVVHNHYAIFMITSNCFLGFVL